MESAPLGRMIQPNIRETLLKLRKVAKEKSQEGEQKCLEPKDVLLLLARALPETKSLLVIDAMKQDLAHLSLYDCVSSWCDIEKGLSKQFPLEVLQVALAILPIEK